MGASRIALCMMAGLALSGAPVTARANDPHGAAPAAHAADDHGHAAPDNHGHADHGPATPGGPIPVSVAVDGFALVERAPVRNGFGPFAIEATRLLPAPRQRDDFTPSDDDHFYTLRRTVERFLQRKEIPVGWSRANDASFSFANELSHLRNVDGVAYAVKGELVVRGTSAIPLGLKLTAPADGVTLRYSVGLMVADRTVTMQQGILDASQRQASWTLALSPNGPDAAIPVRAVFAVRAEGGDADSQRKTLSGVIAALTSSSDGRAATAERANDASEWLKPQQVFLRPDDVKGDDAHGGGGEHGGKAEKKEKKAEGGHH